MDFSYRYWCNENQIISVKTSKCVHAQYMCVLYCKDSVTESNKSDTDDEIKIGCQRYKWFKTDSSSF